MKTNAQIAKEVISLYKTKSQIKRMQENIKRLYNLDNSGFSAVLKEVKSIIDGAISANYDGAISNVKNGRWALLDAFKRACKSGRFVRELSAYDIEKDIDYIIGRFFPAVSENGNACKKVYDYAKNEDGTIKIDKDGKRIVLASWYEETTITAGNAHSIVVRCLNKMKAIAKSETTLSDGWNLVKVGRN